MWDLLFSISQNDRSKNIFILYRNLFFIYVIHKKKQQQTTKSLLQTQIIELEYFNKSDNGTLLHSIVGMFTYLLQLYCSPKR